MVLIRVVLSSLFLWETLKSKSLIFGLMPMVCWIKESWTSTQEKSHLILSRYLWNSRWATSYFCNVQPSFIATMKFTVSQRVEVNKFCWVSKKMQIESSFSFKMCEVSRGKLLKAQLSVNFQNPMCVSLTSFDVFESWKSFFCVIKTSFSGRNF